MRLFRPGLLSRLIYPRGLFRISTKEKVLFLSFDDGPERGSTERILDILERNKIRALFFCTGKNAVENPFLMQMIRSSGHIVGNHGYLHLNGLTTPKEEYKENIRRSEALTSDRIFRPPYGRLSFPQYLALKEKYHLVFWDIMPYDFDPGFPASSSLDILRKMIRPGSVIVFHDKPGSSVHEYLEEFINYSLSAGYRFGVPEILNQ